MSEKKFIAMYTDGCCLRNPGKGGYSIIVVDKSKNVILEKLGQGRDLTTNNEMELMAVYKAIKRVNQLLFNRNKEKCCFVIYSDSLYVVKGLNEWAKQWKKKGWRKSDNKLIKNQMLWSDTYELFEQTIKTFDLKIKHVKGHNGNEYNEIADQYAKEVANVCNNKSKVISS